MTTSKTWKRSWELSCGRQLEERSGLSLSRCYEHRCCASVHTKMLTTCQAGCSVANICIRSVLLALDSGSYGLHRFEGFWHLRNYEISSGLVSGRRCQSFPKGCSFSLCAVVLTLHHHHMHPNSILRSSELDTHSRHCKLSSVHNPYPQTRWRGRVLCADLFVELRWYNDTMATRSQQGCSASNIGSDGRGHAQSLRPHRNRSKAEGSTALERRAAVSRKNFCE